MEKVGIIVVDIQRDFTKFGNGSLAVDGTDEAYIKEVELATRKAKEAGLPIFATQDWHPANHVSFYTNHEGKKPFEKIMINGKEQVLWRPRCVQNSPGADILLSPDLFKAVIRKGMNTQYDSYSGFQDDGGHKTELDNIFKKEGISTIVVYSISTTYCAKFTALDGLSFGYQVIYITNLSRRTSSDPATAKAIEEMKNKGIIVLNDYDFEKIRELAKQ